VPFNAEEYWMEGSYPFAQKCATENMNIIAHFNMDMIGWFPPNNSNTIMASGYSYISKALFEYYHQTANTYVPSIPTIRLSEGDSYGGDHMSFNIYEYPSLYIGDIEYHNQHPCYHKMCDTIGPYQVGVNCGVNRLDLAKAFVQTVLSATAELANAWLPPQNVSACSGIGKINVSWDNAGENAFYKVYRNNLFVKETTDIFYIDTDVEIGQRYEYYVIAVNDGQETAPSNKDKVAFVEPLQLPYSSNFSANKYGFEQSNWGFWDSDKIYLCNALPGNGNLSDNYLSIAEMDWFSIPDTVKNISIRFKWRGTLNGIWKNAGLFFEITNDRKTWHKLAHIPSGYSSSETHEFSLDEYINNDFFQARFRLESSGANDEIHQKFGAFTDVEIVFEFDTVSIKEPTPYISSFTISPNPASTYIHIKTTQQEPYRIAIYEMTGRLIFAQDAFRDGELSVADLKQGNYLVVASTKQHRVARKLVIQ
jgi:hypothetical protein